MRLGGSRGNTRNRARQGPGVRAWDLYDKRDHSGSGSIHREQGVYIPFAIGCNRGYEFWHAVVK